MKRQRIRKIEANPLVADMVETQKIRTILKRLKAKSRGMSRNEFQHFIDGLTDYELIVFSLPRPGQLVDWSEASEPLLRAMEGIYAGNMAEADLPETLAAELEHLPTIPEWVWTPNGPARWVRERLATYQPPLA